MKKKKIKLQKKKCRIRPTIDPLALCLKYRQKQSIGSKTVKNS